VLLNIVSLAGDEGGDDLAGRQADTGGLSFTGVGLLGFRDTNTNAYALFHGGMDGSERGGGCVASASAFSASLLERKQCVNRVLIQGKRKSVWAYRWKRDSCTLMT
jgi:hypothetical protein